jgi:hypothetical protein
MVHRVFASSDSKWAGLLLAFVVGASMIFVCGLVLKRRDTQPETARIHEPPADEMTQITEYFAAMRGGGTDFRLLPLRREPLKRWDDASHSSAGTTRPKT